MAGAPKLSFLDINLVLWRNIVKVESKNNASLTPSLAKSLELFPQVCFHKCSDFVAPANYSKVFLRWQRRSVKSIILFVSNHGTILKTAFNLRKC